MANRTHLSRDDKSVSLYPTFVLSAFDTDCNGATVGSIMGMKNGIDSIDECWKKPLNDKIETTLIQVGTVKISEMAKKTMEHIYKK